MYYYYLSICLCFFHHSFILYTYMNVFHSRNSVNRNTALPFYCDYWETLIDDSIATVWSHPWLSLPKLPTPLTSRSPLLTCSSFTHNHWVSSCTGPSFFVTILQLQRPPGSSLFAVSVLHVASSAGKETGFRASTTPDHCRLGAI